MNDWKGHIMIVGRTGSGKTYHVVNHIMPKIKNGIFFFNGSQIDHRNFSNSSLLCTSLDNIQSIKKMLNRNKTIIYTPSVYQEVANNELKIWQQVFMSDQKNEKTLTIIIDEVQRNSPQGSIDTPCHILATGGRRWGIECIFITQRIADVSKTVASQCQNWIIFNHSAIDRQYLIRKGITFTEEEDQLLKARRYIYFKKEV